MNSDVLQGRKRNRELACAPRARKNHGPRRDRCQRSRLLLSSASPFLTDYLHPTLVSRSTPESVHVVVLHARHNFHFHREFPVHFLSVSADSTSSVSRVLFTLARLATLITAYSPGRTAASRTTADSLACYFRSRTGSLTNASHRTPRSFSRPPPVLSSCLLFSACR